MGRFHASLAHMNDTVVDLHQSLKELTAEAKSLPGGKQLTKKTGAITPRSQGGTERGCANVGQGKGRGEQVTMGERGNNTRGKLY